MHQPLALHELNALVRDTLRLSLPADYWLAAEISECRVAANGHCYLELVEKEPHGRGLLAKAAAHIWRPVLALLRPYFEQAAGRPLAAGMKVLVQVSVEFHELYGYSLNVTDIDPTYTLGDLARRRQEILQQLAADGVLELNKELPLPRPLTRIAVVSSAKAAGYGDFCHQLEQSPYRFEVCLFEAVMQGDRVEESVIAALDRIAAAQDDFDAVALVRGGGAVSDLQGFESYLLAANVAQFPLPVLTGIGHERDDTVVDAVAHTRLKTPTAVAAFLIATREAEVQTVHEAEARLHTALSTRLEAVRRRFNTTARRLQFAATRYSAVEGERLSRLYARLHVAADRQLQSRHAALDGLSRLLEQLSLRRMETERNRLFLLQKAVRLAGPERILNMGFSITCLDGRPVRDAARLKPGDRLVTTLQSGTVTSLVQAPLPAQATSSSPEPQQ